MFETPPRAGRWGRRWRMSPSGSRSGSGDQTARLWETSSAQLLSTFVGHTDGVSSVAFSHEGSYAITTDGHGWVLFWSSREPNEGNLLSLYVASYNIGAISWQDAQHVVLADTGGPEGRPHFYRLQLEGEW